MRGSGEAARREDAVRLFVAVCFPDSFLDVLEDCQRSLRRTGAQGNPRWSKRDNLHLTLAFVGERQEAESAIKALDVVRFSPFRLRVGDLMKFGDTLTLGIRDGGECRKLALAVRSALDDAGIPYDKKPPVPHITLARRYAAPLPDSASLIVPDSTARVPSFRLMLSDLTPTGAVYTPLKEFQLR